LREELVVYGFGSYFLGCAQYSDVDILIVHRSGNYESCRFAIEFKQLLASIVFNADITILSRREEKQISFIAKSNAKHIGNVFEGSERCDMCEILKKIGQVSEMHRNQKASLRIIDSCLST